MIRHSGAGPKEWNPNIKDWSKAPPGDGTNMAFFHAAIKDLPTGFAGGDGFLAIGFVGQRDLPGVALRRAQAILRWDLRPSLWSHTFLITGRLGRRPAANVKISEVTLHTRTAAFPDPFNNGVVEGRLGSYNDAEIDANVGLIAFKMEKKDVTKVSERALGAYNLDRQRYDLWDTLGVWQSYFWSAGAAPNPLRQSVPMFNSAFVEYCYEAMLLDLSPGADERNSAPEHLWNAAVWWHKAFNTLQHPVAGAYLIRDPHCSVTSADSPRTEKHEGKPKR